MGKKHCCSAQTRHFSAQKSHQASTKLVPCVPLAPGRTAGSWCSLMGGMLALILVICEKKKQQNGSERAGESKNVAKTAEILYHQSVKIVVVTLGGMEHIFTAAGRTGSVCPFWKRRCKPLCGEKKVLERV